jgi:hypothetical protein
MLDYMAFLSLNSNVAVRLPNYSKAPGTGAHFNLGQGVDGGLNAADLSPRQRRGINLNARIITTGRNIRNRQQQRRNFQCLSPSQVYRPSNA